MLTAQSHAHFLSSLFDALPQSVYWAVPELDAAGNITDFVIRYGNESGGKHIGIPHEALAGTGILSGVEMEAAMKAELWAQLLEVYRTGQKAESTYYDPIRQKYLHTVRTRTDEGILTIATDVTESQKALHALEQQTQLNSSLLDASINGLLFLEAERNAAGRVVRLLLRDANRRFEELAGLPLAAARGQSMADLLPGTITNGFLDQAIRVVEVGENWRNTLPYADGRINGWFDMSVVPMGTGCVVSYADVTDLHRQQEQMQEHSRELQGILDAAQTRMLVLVPDTDANGTLVDATVRIVNRAYADFKGLDPEAMKGRKARTLFPPQHIDSIFRHYQHTLDTGSVSRFDLHCDDPGRIYWVDVVVTRFGSELLVTITDYTQLRLLQLQLEQKVKELQRSNRNLEEFAYAASHDLKEPIRKVRFFVDRLRAQYNPGTESEEARTFGRLETATERMRDLVDDLLAYAQVSLRPQMLEPLALDGVLRNVLVDLELEIEQLGARVQLEALPSVQGHHRQLQQLFQNIIANALKYHRLGVTPEITIRAKTLFGYETPASLGPTEAAHRYEVIEVSDNGIGFEQSDAERIFQVFQRLHGNSEYRGTGVGLSIARKVAENHHGFVYAEGRPGAGASFFIGLRTVGTD